MLVYQSTKVVSLLVSEKISLLHVTISIERKETRMFTCLY